MEQLFNSEISRASQRAQIRKQIQDDSDNKAKSSSPGPWKSEDNWIYLENKFENYLSTILGVDGVPLSYVTRELENPEDDTVYTSFVEETVACAPLTGSYFDADSDTVHQSIVSFTVGKNSENWIKKVKKI